MCAFYSHCKLMRWFVFISCNFATVSILLTTCWLYTYICRCWRMPTVTLVSAADTGSLSLVGQRMISISLLQVC